MCVYKTVRVYFETVAAFREGEMYVCVNICRKKLSFYKKKEEQSQVCQ